MNEFEIKLERLKKIRKQAYWPSYFIMTLIFIGFYVSLIVPPLAPLMGLVILLASYRKIRSVAVAPCPRCGESFGTDAEFPLGIGGSRCQNCGLYLDKL